jgi:hypothetical protein
MGNNNLVRQVLVPLATILTIAANSLINVLRLNGLATGEISDSFPNFFVPAGYVFAIWGIIYIGLIVFAFWQAMPTQMRNPRLHAIAQPYLLSCVANVVWLVCFHYLQFGAAMLMMLALLALLITCYLRLDVGRGDATSAERAFTHVPFSIYLGWVTVATIANATQLLVSAKWDGFGIAPQTWAALMIGAAVIVALLMFFTRRDVAYLLVLVWAIAGIGVKQAAVPTVSTPAWIATVLVALFTIASLFTQQRAPSTAQ